MGKIGKSLFLVLSLAGLVFVPALSSAQTTQVFATVDRDGVSVGDTFTYKITVTSDASVDVEPPRLGNIQGMELINSWSSSGMQSVMSGGNFQVVHSKEFNFMLAASQPGKVVLPAADVVVGGKSFRTEAITIDVSAAGAGGAGNQARRLPPSQQGSQDQMFNQMEELEQQMFNQLLQRRFGGNPGGAQDMDGPPVNPNEAFFIRAETDKKTAYVGEQVTANWYLYTRGNITDIDTLKYPNLKGFWKEEIEMATRLDFESVVVNGIPYQRALLVSYALFPIKAGKAVVDSYKAKCTVITPGNFGFGRPYQFTKASPPIEVNVIDVPKENRPADFTGAVGSFKVNASLDHATIPAHQPVTWKVRVEGRGNAKLIDLPSYELPPGLEVYDQKSDSKFAKNGTSFKTFEILLIPRESGEVTIPALKLSVFNPEKKTFERIESQSLKLTVTEGKRGDQPLAQNMNASTPQQPVKPAEFQYPYFGTPESTDTASTGMISGLWIGLFALSAISSAVHGFLALGRTRRKETLNEILKVRQKRMKKLLQANDWRGLGAEFSNGTYKILGFVVGADGGSKDLESLLRAGPPSLKRELGDSLREFLSAVEVLAFAPEELARASAGRENLLKLQDQFDKLMKSAIQKVEED